MDQGEAALNLVKTFVNKCINKVSGQESSIPIKQE